MIRITLILLLFACGANAQLKIDTSYSVEDLIDKILVGNGMRIGNVTLTGHKIGFAYFKTDSAVIGMNRGILLSTGRAIDACGDNNTPGKSGNLRRYQRTSVQGKKRYRRGDRDLNRLCKGRTYDVNIVEFDFVPFHNRVAFNYCFASEEYREYVGSRFNDVFAFIVSGPGMRKTNLAVLPGTNEPITINNVNHKKNKEFYINNDYFVNTGMFKNIGYKPKTGLFRRLWTWLFHRKDADGILFYSKEWERKKLNQVMVNHFQYDGFTTVFEAEFHVVPFQKYHLKIAIGDAGDAIFDSGVFLEQGSFTAIRDTSDEDYLAYDDLSGTFNFDSAFYKPEPIVDIEVVDEEQFVLTNIYFDNDKFIIPDSGKSHLLDLANYLIDNSNVGCSLWGFTDDTGSKRYNQKLSEKRALQVVYFLRSKGIHPDRLEYQGQNSMAPISDNNTEEGRAQNRRVEITLLED